MRSAAVHTRAMFRNVSLIVRKPGVSRQEFRDHYEDVHAPLAVPFMDGLEHYQRNHVRRALVGGEPSFDVVSEFGFASVEKAMAMQAVLESEAGQVILDDEATFMDKPRNRFFAVDEPRRVVDGGPLTRGATKLVVLARAPEGPDAEAFAADALPALLERAGDVVRCETHRPLGGPDGTPWHGVAFVWVASDRYDPAALARWQPGTAPALVLEVEECVTEL